MNKLMDEFNKGQIFFATDFATITFERMLRHSPQLVWETITNPQSLKKWLKCSTASIEPKEGGSIEIYSRPAQLDIKGRIMAWAPPHALEYLWNAELAAEMTQREEAICRYELAEEMGSTLLSVNYRQLSLQRAFIFAPGIHVSLDRLEALLDNRELPDWETRLNEISQCYQS